MRTLRSAADGAAHHGALSAAVAWLRRALAESPAEQQRGEILCDLGRWEVAAMQFEAAEEHLRACLTSGADLPTRADAAATFARCAVVSGGRSAEAAADALATLGDELRPVDAERALGLGSELVTLAIGVPRLRGLLAGQLQRFRAEAAGHPGFEAVARIYDAHQQLWRGGCAATAAEATQEALAAGLPPGTETNAGLLALFTLRDAERHEVALRLLDAASEQARREGHATRQGIIHVHRAAIALADGSLHDAQVEADTGLRLVTSATSCSRCCSRWRSWRTSNAGPWPTRSSWPGAARRSS